MLILLLWESHEKIRSTIHLFGKKGRKHPGQPLRFSAATYRRRNVIERCVNKLKQWRGIATRYEKRAVNYRAMVIIATMMLWLAK